MPACLPLLELRRGRVVESVHLGSIAAVDSAGTTIAAYGDPGLVAFLRSSAKPFQALPFVERGGADHYGFSARELALACASHEGARIHLEAVGELQARIGIGEEHLQCGGHLPGDPQALRAFISGNLRPTPNMNNCSGKHTAMLAQAKMRGLSLETYLDPAHPIQQEILSTLCEMCGLQPDQVEPGVDGCSAPNFAIPLRNAALGTARLCDPRDLTAGRAAACRRITSAMTAHPEMVSNHGEFDCELMKVSGGRILTKRGAEGFQIIGILPGTQSSRGIGIAFKVLDGDPGRMNDTLESAPRARPAVALEILRQLHALDEAQLKKLASFGPEKTLRNYAGLVTGRSAPVFQLA
jgi:L-asparaginase II